MRIHGCVALRTEYRTFLHSHSTFFCYNCYVTMTINVLKTVTPIHGTATHTLFPAWSQVRDDSNHAVDWLIAGYLPPSGDKNSKTTTTSDITVLHAGCGGIETCASSLPIGKVVFGGLAVNVATNGSHKNGANRFVTFFYCDESAPTMLKGRASLHKNGTCC